MNQKEAVGKRRKILATLAPPGEVLRGWLLERAIFYSKGGARCEKGEGHKVWVLTVTYRVVVTGSSVFAPATADGAALAGQL